VEAKAIAGDVDFCAARARADDLALGQAVSRDDLGGLTHGK
jgi:hypothetical protein